ncbi:thermonuclease family protein [Bacteriovorax sp. PP10]|uniref:Thermonuclease family protein n=1 Tax=Bacteriovorax antarcticus TaxID=3088717 RepID=A0ABU5VYZ2_9BACT|nr:thermonuclease family protein [Bacteriovorax sp. PP10]MEA9358182.1 thermonuclease family protein [Bacteriovorax sp. PP10]
MLKIYLALFILSFLQLASAETLVGRVLSLHDGDTITVQFESQSKKEKVRLLGVDTPEVDFNGKSQGEVAEMARSYLKSLLPVNSTIQVELPKNGLDSNGRYLGKILYNGVDINLEMLKAGMGAVYFIYPYDKKTAIEYMSVSETAAQNGLGIFSEKFKSAPLGYMFRQMTKGVPGTNFVADFETKKLYSSKDIELVPHYHRVFFSLEETALIHGFNW